MAWVVEPASGRRIDQAVVTFRRSPKSYTGEDTAEVHLHGGRAVVSRVLALLRDAGARPAEAGEFTMRAFLNGRIDLARAEAVAQIVSAESRAQLDCAARALTGELSAEFERLYSALLAVTSGIEARIEFPEDGVEAVPEREVAAALERTRSEIAALAMTFREGRMIAEGARVVIAGLPNAGKSSLFNALCGNDRAIVTDVPGTTRDALEAVLDWQGLPVRLFDTAGLRESGEKIEMLGVERTLRHIGEADSVIYVMDGSRPADPADADNLSRIAGHVVVALNKSDLPGPLHDSRFTTHDSRPGFPPCETGRVGEGFPSRPVRCSALTGQGVPQIKQAVLDLLAAANPSGRDELVITNARHYNLLREAGDSLKEAIETLSGGATEDLVAGDVASALGALGRVTGKDVTSDVLGGIFSKFCIGK